MSALRRNRCSVLICVLLMLTASMLHGAVEIGVSGHYAFFSEKDYQNGFGAGLLAHLPLGKAFALELSGGILLVPTLNDNQGLGQGDLTLMPVQLGLFYRLALSSKFAIRLGGGVGYGMSRFKLEDQTAWENLGFSVSQKLKPGFMYHGALGLDLAVSPKTTLFLEGRYNAGQFDGEYAFSDGLTTVSDNWRENISYLSVSLGIRFSLRKEAAVQRFVVPERTKE
jgi:hypothetical protein